MSDDKRDATRGQDCYRVYVAPWESDTDREERSSARRVPRPRRGRSLTGRRRSALGRASQDAVERPPRDADEIGDPGVQEAIRLAGPDRP